MKKTIKVMLSNRHIHLCKEDLETLYGQGYELTKLRDIGSQFASKETVTIEGSKGRIENVRILGPLRKKTQVELLRSDCFKLGVNAPVRESGNLEGAAILKLIGQKGEIESIACGIVAMRHIHIKKDLAAEYGLKEGQIVSVKTEGERGLIFNNVLTRISKGSLCSMHVDTEEGNAAGLKNSDLVEIIT